MEMTVKKNVGIVQTKHNVIMSMGLALMVVKLATKGNTVINVC